jgi:hypothetical protein
LLSIVRARGERGAGCSGAIGVPGVIRVAAPFTCRSLPTQLL